MENKVYRKLIDNIASAIEPLATHETKYQSIIDKIGDARFVLIGEATHGTYEFYQARIEITKQLIKQKGFMAVAIEGDWPDAYQVHRYLQGQDEEKNCEQALINFNRFPTWMWRNKTMPPFLLWLRKFNDKLLDTAEKIGFYGLDLYSLRSSIESVIKYLASVDKEAALRARRRYECFDHLTIDPQEYGYLTTSGLKKSCIKEVMEQLLELQHNALAYIRKNGITAEDELFFATQNARLIKNAENYYRAMFEKRLSWNIRDEHMAETLNNLADHLENKFKKPAKIVVWAHNSHIGDARATEMGDMNEVNLGQLVREQHDNDTYLLGFSTYQGTVTAASDWGASPQKKIINPGLLGSYETLFHDLHQDKFLLDLRNKPNLEHYLNIPRLQRAIGVIYRPQTERASHYFFSRLPYQFDCIIHFDKTHALQPLDNHKGAD